MSVSKTLIAALLTGLASLASAQAAYPSKPVSIMVPYPAGGLSDLIARMVNVPLAAKLGSQPILVENLGGASGAIAAQKVLDAPADGYYVFQGSPNELILAGLANKAVKFKPEDFRPISITGTTPLAIVARKDLQANSADELVVLARQAAREGKPLTYASVGVGSFYHLIGEDLSKKINAPMLHVPYKGGADVVRDLVGQQVDIFITPYALPQVEMAKAGRIKFIAALTPKRQPLIPNVQSVDEGVALKGYYQTIWSGYFVKKGTPEAIAQQLNTALAAVTSDAKFIDALAVQNQIIDKPQTLAEAAKSYAAGTKQFKDIAKAINLQPQ
jgi:tripartite-type tricarboxylate transporter receptor subunit TctC